MAAGIFVLYVSLVAVLPVMPPVWLSLQKFYDAPSLDALSRISLDAYRSMIAFPGLGRAAFNSVVLSLASAAAVMLIGAVVAWIAMRTRARGRWLLDYLASLPIALPGIALGLAVMVAYLNLPIGIYGTVAILFVAYVTRFLPYGTRAAVTAMAKINRDLEDSAAVAGASWLVTFRRIVLPLLAPGLLAGWTYVAIVTARELSTSVLLYSPRSMVVSVAMWEFWQNGQLPELAGLGVLIVAALLAVSLIIPILVRGFDARIPRA